jgi:hypothetical protein
MVPSARWHPREVGSAAARAGRTVPHLAVIVDLFVRRKTYPGSTRRVVLDLVIDLPTLMTDRALDDKGIRHSF